MRSAAALREQPCRRCGAPIAFVREVESGRLLILNARRHPEGTVVLLGERAQIVPPGPSLTPAYTLHTCGGSR